MAKGKKDDREELIDRPAGTIIALEFAMESVLRSLVSVHPQLKASITEDLRVVSERASAQLPRPLGNRVREVIDHWLEAVGANTPTH